MADRKPFTQEEKAQHFEEIRQRVRATLEEQGIGEQLPSITVLRVVYREVMGFWREYREEVEKEEERVAALSLIDRVQIDIRPHSGPLENAQDVFLIDSDGDELLMGVVLHDKELYMVGHIFTIVQGGRTRGRHEDDTICNPRCAECDEEAVRVTLVDGSQYYAHCSNCGTHTRLFANRWLALAAMMAGLYQSKAVDAGGQDA